MGLDVRVRRGVLGNVRVMAELGLRLRVEVGVRGLGSAVDEFWGVDVPEEREPYDEERVWRVEDGEGDGLLALVMLVDFHALDGV